MPPSVVLEVMRILHEEMDLREETRVVEQAKAALALDAYCAQASMLADTQADLATRVSDVARQVRELPESGSLFAHELAILAGVDEVMLEAQQLLARPETGRETIAAETEAIELLLQARRVNPAGGGGGGSSPGGGGTGSTSQSALALLASGDEAKAGYESREVRQSTGASRMDLPAEYRQGLDAFFDALERVGAASEN